MQGLLKPVLIRERTLAARGDGATAPDQLSEKQRNIMDAFAVGDWGCQRDSVARLIQAITGVDVPDAHKKDSVYFVGTLIRNRGETLLVREIDADGDARFFTAELMTDDSSGSGYISTDKQAPLATDEQIDEFLAQLARMTGEAA